MTDKDWAEGVPRLQLPNRGLIDQLKARVITGETLSDLDQVNAKRNLTVAEQEELRDFLGEDYTFESWPHGSSPSG